MVDSIGSTSGINSTQRSQQVSQPATLRNNPTVLDAIVQTQQRSSGATSSVTALAVPQTAKSGNSNNVKLPRGSLVDLLA